MDRDDTSSSEAANYKGVRKRKWGKWVSEIRLPNSRERIWLGSYDTAEKAARAFDAALYCLRGPGAKFNFPDNPPPPDIVGGQSLSPCEIRAAAARYANNCSQQQYAPTANKNVSGVNTTGGDELSSSSPNAAALENGTTATTTMEEIDWSFLGCLDSRKDDGNDSSVINEGLSDFGLYSSSGMEDIHMSMGAGDFCPSPPQESGIMDFHPDNMDKDQTNGDDDDDQGYSQHSFLWNF